MVRWLLPLNRFSSTFLFFCGCNKLGGGYRYEQKCGLVNVKLKWVKDNVLDSVVSGERDLKAASIIVSIIASSSSSISHACLPIYHISCCRGQIGLPPHLKVSTFMRKYPNIFDEFHVPDTGGTPVPWFRLTPKARIFYEEERDVLRQNQKDFVDRLCKLLMLTKDRMLPLQTIEQLKWDLGLPFDYGRSLIPFYSELFSFVRLPDDRVGLKLLVWDHRLAVSQLVKSASSQQMEADVKAGQLSFPVGFTRGFGLKRKCIAWLEEWQTLPYTCPYSDASHLDPRTDVAEKRIVGVFHELLHLTVRKQTERQNVSNLRKPLALPQKFTKVFERHPGIFYISKKNDTQTVVLREAYNRHQLIQKNTLSDIRERFAYLMEEGLLDRSRGLYKKKLSSCQDKGGLQYACDAEHSEHSSESEGESDYNILSEYESD